MADDDDLDAFFDEVQQVEAQAEIIETVEQQTGDSKKDAPGDQHERKEEDTQLLLPPPAKKPKIVVARVVVAASAASMSSATSTADTSMSRPPLLSSSSSSAMAPQHVTHQYQQPQQQLLHHPPAPPPPPLMSSVTTMGARIPPPPPPPPKPTTTTTATTTPAVTNQPHLRTAAGKTWVDAKLADWPASDFRLFCGNLGQEVTDDMLWRHFSCKYKTIQRAAVIRDPKTSVSKGYGFVSLTDALECAAAIRQMDQTWLGSRPIKVKRSHWKEREVMEASSSSVLSKRKLKKQKRQQQQQQGT